MVRSNLVFRVIGPGNSGCPGRSPPSSNPAAKPVVQQNQVFNANCDVVSVDVANWQPPALTWTTLPWLRDGGSSPVLTKKKSMLACSNATTMHGSRTIRVLAPLNTIVAPWGLHKCSRNSRVLHQPIFGAGNSWNINLASPGHIVLYKTRLL
jgi:hypothetical protein